MAYKKGIDVSEWQANIDWKKVKADGIEFAILRSSYRNTVDKYFFQNVTGAKSAGMPITGVYHFSYALNVDDATKEADFCIDQVEKSGLGKNVIIWYDFEYDTVTNASKKGVTLNRDHCSDFSDAFCKRAEARGYSSGIYANIDFYTNWYRPGMITDPARYKFWLADYTGEPNYPCYIQQYGSTGKVNGIAGNVDMNYLIDNQNRGVTPGEPEKPVDTGEAPSAQYVLNVARAWIGRNEASGSFREIIDLYNNHKPLALGYKVKYTDEWCDTFVSAVAIKAGAVDIIGTECGCERHIQIFKDKGIWIEDGSILPQPGDIILFNWDTRVQPNDGFSDHIGYVESTSGNMITTIEGNYSGGVNRRTLAKGNGQIRGYARPKYGQASTPTADDLPILRQGDTGAYVIKLQTLLGDVEVDGDFGPATKASVIKFQTANWLEADGIVGPMTWGALMKEKPKDEPKPEPPKFPNLTTEQKEIIDTAKNLGYISDPDHWYGVLSGFIKPVPQYIQALMNNANNKIKGV